MKHSKLLILFTLTSLLLFSCKKDDNEEVITNYPSIIGEWIIVRYDKTVIKDGTLDETQTMKIDYPGTILFSENGSEVINFDGVEEQNTYIDKGDYITTNPLTNKKSKLSCRIRTSNQLIFDIVETEGSKRTTQSYILEKEVVNPYLTISGNWLIIRFDQTEYINGNINWTNTVNYWNPGYWDFYSDGTATLYMNHITYTYTYQIVGPNIVFRQISTGIVVEYRFRLWNDHRIIIDHIETSIGHEKSTSFILEKN